MKRRDIVPPFPEGIVSTMAAAPVVALKPPLAHQGGWDEILMVVAPLAVIGLMLWIANRRVSAQIAAETAASNPSTDPGSSMEPQAKKPGDGSHDNLSGGDVSS